MTSAPVPMVSIIMPVLNEREHLEHAVGQILSQRYDGELELIIAVGPSSDGTWALAQELARDPRVRVVDNPTGKTPSGLNAAIAAARGEIIVRVDGHAMIPEDYVAVGVQTLERTGADNVGGVMDAQGLTPFGEAVARAMTSRFGVGGASFHVGGQEGSALTVYLGTFRKSALVRVGGYDESMVRAQDWEMNLRIRNSGGTVWFTPLMRVTYRPRTTLGALARQYRDYGRWRREVARRHPETVSLRYLAAPALVTALIIGAVLILAAMVTLWWPLAVLGVVPFAGYAIANLAATLLTARTPTRLVRAAAFRLPAIYATMHCSWGWGFIRGGADRGQP